MNSEEVAGVYKLTWERQQIVIEVSRLKEHSDRLDGELAIRTTSEIIPNPVLAPFRLNFMGPNSKRDLAKQLEEWMGEVDWKPLLEEMSAFIIKSSRQLEKPRRIDSYLNLTPEFMVHPLIAQGKPNVIYGDGGTMKSYIALFLGILVQNGLQFPGLTVKQANVAYLDWESDYEDFCLRASLICQESRYEGLEMPFYVPMVEPLPESLPDIARFIAEEKIGLILNDSLAMAAPGDVVEANSAKEYYRALRKLGRTSLTIAHISKEDSQNKKAQIYGSVFFKNYARNTWEVKGSDDMDSPERLIGLFNRKLNVARRSKPFGLRFKDLGNRLVIEPADPTEEFTQERTLPARIKDFLKEHGKSHARDIASYLEAPEGSVGVNLSRLLARKEIVQVERGVWGMAESLHKDREVA